MYRKLVLFIFFIFSVNLSNKVKADFFQELQPKNEIEVFLYGGAAGVANTICALLVENKISLDYAKGFRKDYVNYFKETSKRNYDVAKAGFNDGISSMEIQGNEYKKCISLKSN